MKKYTINDIPTIQWNLIREIFPDEILDDVDDDGNFKNEDTYKWYKSMGNSLEIIDNLQWELDNGWSYDGSIEDYHIQSAISKKALEIFENEWDVWDAEIYFLISEEIQARKNASYFWERGKDLYKLEQKRIKEL